jgi:hypothetical protein
MHRFDTDMLKVVKQAIIVDREKKVVNTTSIIRIAMD